MLIKIPEADSPPCKYLYMDPSSQRSKGWNLVICKEALLVSLWRHCWVILLCVRWRGLSSWEDGTGSDQVVVILSSTTFTNKAIWVFLHILVYLWILCWYMNLYGQYIYDPILFTVKDLYALMVLCCCESTSALWSWKSKEAVARFCQRGKETSKEPSGRLRLVLFASFSSLSRKGKTSDFNLFVSNIATHLSGTSSSE